MLENVYEKDMITGFQCIHKFCLLDDCKTKQKANKEDMELASQISFKVIELECARIKQLNK